MSERSAPPSCTAVGAGDRHYYYCDYAWTGDETPASGVTLTVSGGRIEAVDIGSAELPGSHHLVGLTVPGLANAHSHAFHRALRSRAERVRGTFWTWRDMMYELSARLTPERYFALARAVYGEMALAGITAVGEFHYLHHAPGGARYSDPNEMGRALLAAGREAGVKVVLLDACYLEAGPGRPLEGPQVRFGDGNVDAWLERADALADKEKGVVGAAIHSLRAVPPDAASRVAEWAARRVLPLQVHCSEQQKENEEVLAAYGATPVQLLAGANVLGPRTVVVHATHLSANDTHALGSSHSRVCICPTTERDLGDGIGQAPHLLHLGSPLCLGSDSHAVIDPFEEMRALELNARLGCGRRGIFSAVQLLEASTSAGYAAIGDLAGGRLEVGAPADFVTLSLDGLALAGISEEFLLDGAVFAACSRDVTDVVVEGRPIVASGAHLLIDDVPAALRKAIADLEVL